MCTDRKVDSSTGLSYTEGKLRYKQDNTKVVLVITVNCYIFTIILTRGISKIPVQICKLGKVAKSNLS